MRKVVLNKTVNKQKLSQGLRMQNDPLVRDIPISIIIPAWKYSIPYIKECLDSIQKQSYFIDNDKFQIILGLDGYEQKDLEYLKSIKDNYRNLKLFYSQQNVGTYIMCNSLFQKSKYDNIVFFGSDDIMKQRFVERTINTNYQLVYTKFINFDKKKTYVQKQKYSKGACLMKRSLFEKIGGYFQYRIGSDDGFRWTCRKNGIKMCKIMQVLILRRLHQNCLTIRKDTKHRSYKRISTDKLIKKRISQQKIPIKRVTTNLIEV